MPIGDAKVAGLTDWLWLRSGVLTTAASLKLVYGCTGWDVPRNRTHIKTATLTTLGATGARAGYKTHGTIKITCLEDEGLAADFSSYCSKFDFLTAFNSATNVPLTWGPGSAAGVAAASTIMSSGSFVVLDVSESYKVDNQAQYDVTLVIDGDYTTYTTT